ncbi:MAG: hypothetical protein WCR67_06330 [Bacilli bacterium]
MEKNYIAYEYMTKSCKNGEQGKLIDMYEVFGWEASDTTINNLGNITISFKRDRKIEGKQELNKLQREAQQVSDLIKTSKNKSTSFPLIVSLIIGIIGALVLGGGMSMVMILGEGSIPNMVIGILIGIVGIIICLINYPIFKTVTASKTKKYLPIIDEYEEKLANILENADTILRKTVPTEK